MNYYMRHKAWPHFTIHLSQGAYALLSAQSKTWLLGACLWNETSRTWEGVKGEKEMLSLCRELCLPERKEESVEAR